MPQSQRHTPGTNQQMKALCQDRETRPTAMQLKKKP